MARTVSVWPLLEGEAKAICVAPWIRAVAVKVTGEPERFAPDAVTFCTTESEPVASIVVAIPSAPVVLELEPTVPPPTVGAQVMVTPFTGFPLGSLTITASGLGRVCPAFTTCPSPLVGALARAFCGGGMPPPPPPQAMLMIVVASAAKRDRRESAMPHLRVSRGETPYTPGRPLRCLTGRRGRRICSTRPPLSTDAPSGAAPFGRPPGGSVRQGAAVTRPETYAEGRREVLRQASRALGGLPVTVWEVSARSTSRSEEHTSELQSRLHLVFRLLLGKKKKRKNRLF